jgi:Fe-S oxidoreductase
MFTLIEKILFAIAFGASIFFTVKGVRRIIANIAGAKGNVDWSLVPQRIGKLIAVAVFQPVFRFRLIPSIFHALIGWSFLTLAVTDLLDPIYAFFGFRVLDHLGWIGSLYLSIADLANALVLIGILFMVLRRFVFRPANLSTRETTLLHDKARFGIKRDSFFVALFIISCNVARAFMTSFHLAGHESAAWEPFASALASLWIGIDPALIMIGEHISFWAYFGSILLFLPYFPYSKHIHMFFAPLNFALKPERKSIGQLSYINIDDQSIEQFGAAKMNDLAVEQVIDSYACIMCFRCQEVCPAYNTGKLLSPAALEINKRYHLNYGGAMDVDLKNLISDEAVWACTSCGACVDICPVGNEPMRDILDIRRNLSMMESNFPKQLETAFKGMERNANPWNVSQADRMKWAQGLNVPTIEQNPEPDLLWWVGCAPATDPRAQKTARAFAEILNTAGANFAVIGSSEQCTGDSARRAGREDIFFGLATANVEILNEVRAGSSRPLRIVTTCPHCLHTIKNEYPAFGGNYEVIHHTQLINEFIGNGKLILEPQTTNDERQSGIGNSEWEIGNRKSKIAFHDPCYLGRHNSVFDAPRDVLKSAGGNVIEMPRHAEQSFCCGAGGAQVWKEEEAGTIRVNAARFAEAKSTGAETVAVGCPFCMVMLTDAAKADSGSVNVMDVAEIVAKRLKG